MRRRVLLIALSALLFAVGVNAALWPFSRAKTYRLTVYNGSGTGNYRAGAKVNVTAKIPTGATFHEWTVFSEAPTEIGQTPSFVFIMPTRDAALWWH